MADKKPTELVIGPARFSYAHLTEAVAIGDSTEKSYSVALLIPKTDKAMKKKIEAATAAAVEIGKSKIGAKYKPTGLKFKLPLRDGDEEKPGDPVYKGMYFLNAKSTDRPEVVDKARNEILDKEQIYSGMFGLASVNFYSFDKNGNMGVAVALNNVMKLKDGPKLSAGTTADEDFADIDPDNIDVDMTAFEIEADETDDGLGGLG